MANMFSSHCDKWTEILKGNKCTKFEEKKATEKLHEHEKFKFTKMSLSCIASK